MSRRPLVVGILRETKNKWEKRTPLIPEDVAWLNKRGIEVEVEFSNNRIFKDEEYKKFGATVVSKLQRAELLVGIKEPKLKDIYQNKLYMLFSHTIKGQSNNMPLLKKIINKKNSLVDYERIVDSAGRRLIYFGRFAGICGVIDSLYFYGQKLKWKGIKTPFLQLRPAHEYNSLSLAKKAILAVAKKLRRGGLPEEISPFVIGVTGHGNVSKGMLEVLSLLDSVEVHPGEMLQFIREEQDTCNKIYQIVFHREEKLRHKKGRRYYDEEYRKHPEKFESNLDNYLPYINILLHGSYWDEKFPKVVTKKMLKEMYQPDNYRLELIGDISCDVKGGIEITEKITTPDAPIFTYIPTSDKFKNGYKHNGVSVLAIDNLPAELPGEASFEFSKLIREYVYQIAARGAQNITRHVAIPPELRKAVVVEEGKLTKAFTYLKSKLPK